VGVVDGLVHVVGDHRVTSAGRYLVHPQPLISQRWLCQIQWCEQRHGCFSAGGMCGAS
jgi:hypothetical protein